MSTKIYVNLPVKDLNRSMQFFKALGFKFEERHTDETAACMEISSDIHAMLLTEEKFKTFSPGGICDTKQSNEVLICLTVGSRAEVEELIGKAWTAGGKPYPEPKDYGFMYWHSFQDLDGHVWELMWMDPKAAEECAGQGAEAVQS